MVNGKKRPFLGSGDPLAGDDPFSIPGFEKWTQTRVPTDTGSKIVHGFNPPGHDYREEERRAISQQESGTDFVPGFENVPRDHIEAFLQAGSIESIVPGMENLIEGKLPSAFNRLRMHEGGELPNFSRSYDSGGEDALETRGTKGALHDNDLILLAMRGQLKDAKTGKYNVPVTVDQIKKLEGINALGVLGMPAQLLFGGYEEVARQARYQGEKQGRFMSSIWGGDSEQRFNEALNDHELAIGRKLDYQERQVFYDKFFDAPRFVRGGVELAIEMIIPGTIVEKLIGKGIFKVGVPLSKPAWKGIKAGSDSIGLSGGMGKMADYILPSRWGDPVYAKAHQYDDMNDIELLVHMGAEEAKIDYWHEIKNVIMNTRSYRESDEGVPAEITERLGLDKIAKIEYGYDDFNSMMKSGDISSLQDIIDRSDIGISESRAVIDEIFTATKNLDVIGVDEFTAAQTGKRFTTNLFRVNKSNDLNNPVDAPVLGNHHENKVVIYGAPYKGASKEFGSDEIVRIDLENPLVISSDSMWTTLLREAGLEHSIPSSLNEVTRLQTLIVNRGYDGLVIKITPDTKGTQLLKSAFGHTQAVDLTDKIGKSMEVSKIIGVDPNLAKTPRMPGLPAPVKSKIVDGEYVARQFEGAAQEDSIPEEAIKQIARELASGERPRFVSKDTEKAISNRFPEYKQFTTRNWKTGEKPSEYDKAAVIMDKVYGEDALLLMDDEYRKLTGALDIEDSWKDVPAYLDDAGELLNPQVVLDEIEKLRTILPDDKPKGGWKNSVRKLQKSLYAGKLSEDTMAGWDELEAKLDEFLDYDTEGMSPIAKAETFDGLIDDIKNLFNNIEPNPDFMEAVDDAALARSTREFAETAPGAAALDIVPEGRVLEDLVLPEVDYIPGRFLDDTGGTIPLDPSEFPEVIKVIERSMSGRGQPINGEPASGVELDDAQIDELKGFLEKYGWHTPETKGVITRSYWGEVSMYIGQIPAAVQWKGRSFITFEPKTNRFTIHGTPPDPRGNEMLKQHFNDPRLFKELYGEPDPNSIFTLQRLGVINEFSEAGQKSITSTQQLQSDVLKKLQPPKKEVVDDTLMDTAPILPQRIRNSIQSVRKAADEGLESFKNKGPYPDEGVGPRGIPDREIPYNWRADMDPDDVQMEMDLEARAEWFQSLDAEMKKRGVRFPKGGGIRSITQYALDVLSSGGSRPISNRERSLLYDFIAEEYGDGKSITDVSEILGDLSRADEFGRVERFLIDYDDAQAEFAEEISQEGDQILSEVRRILFDGEEVQEIIEATSRPAGETSAEATVRLQKETEDIIERGYDEKDFTDEVSQEALEHPINQKTVEGPTKTVPHPKSVADEGAGNGKPPKDVLPSMSEGEFRNRLYGAGFREKSWAETFQNAQFRLMELLWDSFWGLRRMSTKAAKSGVIPDWTGDIHDLKTLLTRLPGASQAGYARWRRVANELRSVAPNISPTDVNMYLTSLRLVEISDLPKLEQRELPGNLNIEEVKQGIITLKARLGTKKVEELEAAKEVILKTYRSERRRLYESGLIGAELYAKFENEHKYYNPIEYIDTVVSNPKVDEINKAVQVVDGVTFIMPGLRPSLNVIDNNIRSLSEAGSTNPLYAPLEIMGNKLIRNETLLMQNDGAKAIIKIAQAIPELNAVIKKVPRVGKSERDRTIAFYENGELVAYEVPTWMKRESEYFAGHGKDAVGNFIGWINGISRSAFTAISPVFIPANILNDMLTAYVTRGVLPHSIAWTMAKSITNSNKEINEVHHLAGGYQARFWSKNKSVSPQSVGMYVEKYETRTEILEDGSKVTRKIPIYKPFKAQEASDLVKRGFNDWFLKQEWMGLRSGFGITKVGEVAEQAPRRTYFKQILDKKLGKGWEKRKSAEEWAVHPEVRLAAAQSVELTLNFARGGAFIKQLNNYVIFLNAAFEGFKQPFRAFGRDGDRRGWLRIAGIMSSQSMLTAYNLTYPEYQDIPKEERWGSVIIMLPSTEIDPATGRPLPRYIPIIPRTRQWSMFLSSITYPMERAFLENPTEYGEFSNTIMGYDESWNLIPQTGAILDSAGKKLEYFKDDPMGFFDPKAEGWGDWAKVLAEQVSPITEMPLPVVAKEGIQQMANYDLFRSRPILPSEIQNKPPTEQFMPWTSPTFKAISDAIPSPLSNNPAASPIRMEHAYYSTLGGSGKVVTSVTDAIIEQLDPTLITPEMADLLNKYEAMDNPTDRTTFIHNMDIPTRDEFLNELLKPDKEGMSSIPFFGPIFQRFHPQHYGSLREKSEKWAGMETGIDPQQTRDIHNELRKVGDENLTRQTANDIAIMKGAITVDEWIDSRRDDGKAYAAAFHSLSQDEDFSQAAHFADPEKREKYYNIVSRLGGVADPEIYKGRVLKSAWYSITLHENNPTDESHTISAVEKDGNIEHAVYAPGPQEWEEFSTSKKEFLESLTQDERDILFHEIEATQTPLEREYTRDHRLYIDKYNGIATNVVRFLTGDMSDVDFLTMGYTDELNIFVLDSGLREIFTEIQDDGKQLLTKEEYYKYKEEQDPQALREGINPFLKNSNEWIEFQNDIEAFVNIEEIINPIISEARYEERFNNREMDKALFKWGKTDTAVNPSWQENLRILRADDAGKIQNRLTVDTDLMERMQREYISSNPNSQYYEMPNAQNNSPALPIGAR